MISEPLYASFVECIEDKKGKDISVICLEGLTPIADFFIIATCQSSTQIQAVAEHLDKSFRDTPYALKHKEGSALNGWVLLDFGDVVVHLFSSEKREYYSLERTWNDAKCIEFSWDKREYHE